MYTIEKLNKTDMSHTLKLWLQSGLLSGCVTSAWSPTIELKCANGCALTTDNHRSIIIFLRSKSPKVCHSNITITGSMFMTFCDCSLCPHTGVQAPVDGGMFMGYQYIYIWYDPPVICSLFQNRKRKQLVYQNTVPWVNISITCFILHFTYQIHVPCTIFTHMHVQLEKLLILLLGQPLITQVPLQSHQCILQHHI